MSNIPISSLPLVVSLDGSETAPLVQGGTTKRASVAQINAANIANIPAGGLTGQGLVKSSNLNYATQWKTVSGFGTIQQVDTGTGLTGGPVTLTGSISFAPVAAGQVLANITGGSAAPLPNTPTSIIDLIGSTQGNILYRGASGWAALAPGVNGQILTSQGPAANPQWSAVGSGTVQSVGLVLPSIFTVSGSPVTTTGTLTGSLATQAANLVWSGPGSGAAAAPTFRSLVGSDIPNPSASTLGGIQSTTGTVNRWISSISTLGVPVLTQPAFSNISGVATGAQLPTPTASTLGGVQSLAAVTSRWINTISTAGVPSATQPNFTDLAGSATLAQLPSIGNNTILANTSGGSSTPMATGLTTLIDTLGAVQGDVLYRDGSVWTVLAPGTNGQILTSGGPASNPSWTTVSGTGTVTSISAGTGISTGGSPITNTGTVSLAAIASQRILANVTGGSAVPIPNTMSSLLDLIGSTQGQVLYRGASSWTALSPGTSGQYLQTLGAGSTPQWASAVSSLTSGTAITLSPSTITTTGTVSYSGPTTSGYFSFTSAGVCTFAPSDGDTIKINGVVYSIPSAGVTISNGGMSASTFYYIYIYNNAGTLTLEFSATAPATSTTAGNVGTRIKTGDDTRSLVGAVRVTGAVNFTANTTISWFGRKNRIVLATYATATGTLATNDSVVWGDDAILLTGSGYSGNASAATSGFQLVVDGGVVGSANQGDVSPANGINRCGINAVYGVVLSTGYHTFNGVVTQNAGTSNWTGNIVLSFRG